MQAYLVKLDFEVASALCGPDEGTPEQVAGDLKEMILRCIKEAAPEDENKMRIYHCELVMQADSPDTVGDTVASMFNHLPGFRVISKSADPVKDPPATAATKEYAIVCHFRSTEAYFRLNNAFYEHVAEGFFFAAPKKPGHYVAYVVMHTPSSDGLEKTVEALLRKAFDADSGEKADHFAEVTTNLL